MIDFYCKWYDSNTYTECVGMSGDGSVLTHTCFLEKLKDLSQKIVSSPKYPSHPSPVTIDVISDRFDGFH